MICKYGYHRSFDRFFARIDLATIPFIPRVGNNSRGRGMAFGELSTTGNMGIWKCQSPVGPVIGNAVPLLCQDDDLNLGRDFGLVN